MSDLVKELRLRLWAVVTLHVEPKKVEPLMDDLMKVFTRVDDETEYVEITAMNDWERTYIRSRWLQVRIPMETKQVTEPWPEWTDDEETAGDD